ncbi:hypothetical protein CLV98_107185 [Dyadobacter jejuensis]|uniref:Uncharacterized protein n=1 Tax=Dyadobacter jejuensis TaxID=1082580 RepID=A0A316B4F1_9BACT|nr:contractile injection system tape measure protein [Dyadobacter jejuensis]PWJ57477.1 hypothetical protein CLV98_107185 [Dyadobacter jejuensis]
MKIEQHHIVNSLQLEVESQDETLCFRARKELSTYWQEWLLGTLQMAFDRYSPADQTLRIDKIELDFVIDSAEDFEEQFKEQIKHKLEEHLSNLQGDSPSKVEEKSPTRTDLELLTFFVQNGFYPWWASSEEIPLSDLLHRIYHQDKDSLKTLLERVVSNEVCYQRLCFQIDHTILLDVLTDVFDLGPLVSYIEQSMAVPELGLPASTIAYKMQVLLQTLGAFWATSPSEQADFKDTVHQIIRASRATKEPSRAAPADAPITEPRLAEPHHGQKEFNSPIESREGTTEPMEKYRTGHAGLILIAPFLPQFFKNLSLLDGPKFLDPASQHRAIMLLNYMATGAIAAEEPYLLFEKILCGIPIHAPIPKQMELTPEELTEADELISSIQAHWKPVKNTSLINFRGTFLQREGLLYDEAHLWKLRVERQPYDMLLSTISWGYQYQTYSWTPKPIETEW